MQNSNFNCKYCGINFSKEYKPYIMTCSHNICAKCLQINSNVIKCLECQAKFVKNKIKRFPINFLLLDICSSVEQIQIDNPENLYYCENCNLNLLNDYHKEIFPEHKIIIKGKKNLCNLVSEIENKKSELIKEFYDINKQTTQSNVLFFDKLFDKIVELSNEVNLDEINPFDLLICCGIINPADKERLKFFYEKIYTNEENKKLFLESESFDELLVKLNAREKDSPNYISPNEYMSSLFYFNEIYTKKLINFYSSINEIKLGITKEENQKIFLKEFVLKLNYSLGDYLLANKFKISCIKVSNNFISFDPIEEKFVVTKIENDIGNKDLVSFCLTNNYVYYLFDGMYVYQYVQRTGALTKLQKPNFNEDNRTLFFVENSLYLLSKTFFEKVGITNKIEESEWKILTPYIGEHLIEKPKIAVYGYQSFFVFDEGKKNIKEFYGYEINSKKWKKYSLNLKDASDFCLDKGVLFFYGNIIIFGGYDSEKGIRNQKIFEISKTVNKVKISGEINIHKENYEIYSIDASCKKLDIIYFVICYRRIEEGKKNEFLFEVWKKNGKKEKFEKMENTLEIKL